MALAFTRICSEMGAGKLGTSQGVDWLWRRYEAEFGPKGSAVFELKAPVETDFLEAKNIDQLAHFFQSDLVPKLTADLQKPAFPIILSGDHSNAIGTLASLCAANPDKRIGVLWIDAHCDLHTPFTTPSGNLHGMSLAAATRQDNLACQSRQPSPAIQAYWQQLKNLAPQSQGILLEDLCFLGLRSFEEEEAALLQQHQIPAFSVQQMREQGFEAVLDQVKQQFEAVDLLYVTFDVDALDSALIPATGTPEPEGFTVDEVEQIFQAILPLPKLAMFELTEFNPSLSEDKACYERVYDLFKVALGLIGSR
ncbi:hypothetical protein A4G20_09390 [Pasteurellaceae bacterium RH1A]|nr:hypothetical protein A4G20_09390 [Pasteurellaceae bacterium RH1A]